MPFFGAGASADYGPRAALRSDGFTLLELLIVLLILALLTGLVMPRLSNLYDSFRFAHERDDVLAQLGGLGYAAYREGRAFDLAEYPVMTTQVAPVPLEFPDGWSLRADPPVRYRANGTCGGGEVTLFHTDQQFQVQLMPPFCLP